MTGGAFWTAVVVRVTANPLSNALQKRLTQQGCAPSFVIFATHARLSLFCLPLLAWTTWPRDVAFWSNMALTAALAVACNTLLVKAVSAADLSIVGPINAYKSLVSLVPAMLLLGEFPGPLGLTGIALIVAGSYGLAPRDAQGSRSFIGLFAAPGVRYRFAALVLSGTEAVFLKRALLASDAVTTFVGWSIFGLFVSAAIALRGYDGERRRREFQLARVHTPTFLLLAATTGLMQFSTLVALAAVQVGYALALFQLSSLVSVLLGRHFFGERDTARRLAGAAVMGVGATLIILSQS